MHTKAFDSVEKALDWHRFLTGEGLDLGCVVFEVDGGTVLMHAQVGGDESFTTGVQYTAFELGERLRDERLAGGATAGYYPYTTIDNDDDEQ
jgi:hypothetical protein